MKKKFVLTLALVLMVAVTLTAAPLDVKVSGTFKAGYDFKFVSSGNTVAPTASTTEAEVMGVFNVASDFWKITFKAGSLMLTEKAKSSALAEIYLDKAFAEQGVDMGEIALTLHIGTGVSKDVPSVFADKVDRKTGLAMTATYPTGLTFKYGDLVTVYGAVDPSVASIPMLIGATVNPLDGVSVAGGYTTTNNGVTGSVKVDVAALAGIEDFSLVASAEDIYMIDAKTNELNADLVAGYEGIEAWFAYQMDTAKAHNLAAGAGYKTTINDIGLSASVTMNDLKDIKDTVIEAGANYKMGGVTYALDTKYEVKVETFTLTPSVKIAF